MSYIVQYSEVISKLVAIGRSIWSGNKVTVDQLHGIRDRDEINCHDRRLAQEITPDMNDYDLVAFIVGLVYVEKKFQWGGGSGATSIWFYQVLQARDNVLAEQVGNWILKNTDNPYLPFGGQNHDANSVSEYNEIIRIRANQHYQFTQIDHEIVENAQEDRDLRERQKRKSAEDRYTKIRADMITELEKLDLANQLNRIARDETYSVNFYPTNIADSSSIEIIEKLDPKYRECLAKKMKGRHRGPWGGFKKRLLDVHSVPWDKKSKQELGLRDTGR